MTQKYENIMVAVDGSHESELAFEKGVNVALRNGSRLTIAHVIDTRALQSVSTFDADVYEDLQEDANKLSPEEMNERFMSLIQEARQEHHAQGQDGDDEETADANPQDHTAQNDQPSQDSSDQDQDTK